jgi:hypothetical protein
LKEASQKWGFGDFRDAKKLKVYSLFEGARACLSALSQQKTAVFNSGGRECGTIKRDSKGRRSFRLSGKKSRPYAFHLRPYQSDCRFSARITLSLFL